MNRTEHEGKLTAGPERVADLSRLPDRFPVCDGLEVRKITPADAARLFQILKDNPDIPQHVAWAARVSAVEDVIPSLQRYPSNENLDGRYAVTYKEDVVGYIGIHPGNQDGEFGIGYCLDANARGLGCMTNAVRSLTEQARTHLAARHVYCQVKPDNGASAAVPERLGFTPAEVVMGVDFPVEQRRWRLELE